VADSFRPRDGRVPREAPPLTKMNGERPKMNGIQKKFAQIAINLR